MSRREVLRQSAMGAGVAALWASLPARTWAALALPAGWSEDDEKLLTLIGDTIIPATAGSPGAGAVGIGRFIVVQATECFVAGAGAVEALRRGMKEIEAASAAQFAKTFAELSVAQRERVLTDYEGRAAPVVKSGVPAVGPFRMIKELTLLGYFTSEAGATQALRYLPVPGGYRGSVKLGKDERAWAL